MAKKKSKRNFFNAKKILLEATKDFVFDSAEILEGFLLSAGSSRSLARRIGFSNRGYYQAMQSLKRSGYVRRINQDQFLITPKAVKKLITLKVEETDWTTVEWDGCWKMVVFDIPEKKKRERNILRSLLKRKKFVGIQNSVYISPFADFDQLALIRSQLKIEKYVSFFTAKSANTDSDELLKRRFNLA